MQIALAAAKERASVCSTCRGLRLGQTVDRFFRIVAVDPRACTMTVKAFSAGMSNRIPVGELTTQPCSAYNGY